MYITRTCYHDVVFSGTKEERGIAAWNLSKEETLRDLDTDLYDEGYEVYQPLIPRRFLTLDFIKYIPFLPRLEKRA